jgi:DNA-binding MarR family transcriptional regulator
VLAEHGPQTVPQIARLRGTSRQNIQILVNRLETDGCVELSSNPAHKRSGLVQLTGPGRDLFGRAAEQEDRFLAGLAGRVSAGEVASATSLLHQFRLMLTQAERPGEVSVAAKVPENKPGYVTPRAARRIAPAAAIKQKPAHSAVVESKPESEPDSSDGDLPYNLL